MELSPRDYRALLRRDFAAFTERAFCHLNPTTPFLDNWHHGVLAAKLEACRLGRIRRLIICIPPRSLKSLYASVSLPAWWLGHDPTAQILCVSYAQELANKHAMDCRSVMISDWYQELFRTRLAPHKQALEEFVTTQQGFRMATSIGGVVTGRGADVLLLDDPLKPDEALSDVQRAKVNEWFSHTLYSRLNSKAHGVIILIMQRLHEDDLVGHVLEQEHCDLVSFPAIAEHDEVHLYETPYGPARHHRREGQALHPERESLEVLGRIRQTVGSYHFASQYQQTPAPQEGNLVKRAWFRFYRPEECPQTFDQIVQSWDTANKASELANYSVCTTWGVKGKQIYLLHVYRKQVNYPELKRAVIEQRQQWNATVVLIEDRASGTQLIAELVYEGLPVQGIKTTDEKELRLHAQTALIENGFVSLPQDAPWLELYLHELTSFPGCKYNDQVDSTSQALGWIKECLFKPEPGMLTWIRQECEKMYQQEPHGTRPAPDRRPPIPARSSNELVELYEKTRQSFVFQKRCALCGQPIDGRLGYVEEGFGGPAYHPDCYKKRAA